MTAQIRHVLSWLGDAFWLVPALMVTGGAAAALGLLAVDRSGVVPKSLVESPWLYSGGATGARTLLGAVASSTIGVAGTAFSITIAALSLAAGQMGPRLLRNFVRDRGNQVTLGTFLATFVYALLVLRSVRTESEGAFIPHLALSVGILLAITSVGTLVFFIGHMAGRINVETVLDLVSAEASSTLRRLSLAEPGPAAPPGDLWHRAVPVRDARRGYLQHVDADALADWAAAQGARLRLLVRPGDYVFPGAPSAHLIGADPAAAETAIRRATALAPQRASSDDLEFAIRQIVEVGVRALSPGINDPHTAMGALDRIGATFCEIAPLHLPTGVTLREGRPILVIPAVDYDGLADAAFHMLRQNAGGSVAVLMRMLDVIAAVLSCEADPARRAALVRHADLVMADAERTVGNPADLEEMRERRRAVAAAFAPRHGQRTASRDGT